MTTVANSATLVKIKREGLARLTPLEADVLQLKLRTDDDYDKADTLLSDIRRARRDWAGKIDPILDPLSLATRNLQALNREVDRPLETLEATVKGKMKAFKQEESRRLQEAEHERQEAQRQTQRRLDEAAAILDAAKTKPFKARMEAKVQAIETELAVIEEAPRVQQVKAVSSTARTVKRWRIADLAAILQGVLDGSIPDDIMVVASTAVERNFKGEAGKALVASWPGFEVYDDVIIAGRG